MGCGGVIHTLGDRAKNVKASVVHVEGDPDNPINRGTLCSKGITLKRFMLSDRRLTRPLYRAPGLGSVAADFLGNGLPADGEADQGIA